MLALYLAILGGIAVALGLSSRVLRDAPISEPLVVLVVGAALGPEALGVLDLPVADREQVLSVASELSLAFAVMATCLRFTFGEIRKHTWDLVVLLTVGLVAMAVVSGLLARLVLGVPVAAAVLLGAVLAPTDPVLASNAVSGEPARRDLRFHVRLLVSVEAAANNGLGYLMVVGGIAAVTTVGAGAEVGVGLVEVVWGLVVGAVSGWVAGRLVVIADRQHDMEHSAFLVLTLSLTVFVLGLAEVVGASGIVAVFVAGLAYNHTISESERREEWEVQEAVNRYLVLPVFILFGVALPWGDWADLGLRGPLFVVAVLALRRVPLLLGLRRVLSLTRPEAWFVGWLGPVGVVALHSLAFARQEGAVSRSVWAAGTLAVAASTVAHGVSAASARRLLRDRS